VGAIKIASRGGQNHSLSWEEVSTRFQLEYGYNL
jgi:hypothetical protein